MKGVALTDITINRRKRPMAKWKNHREAVRETLKRQKRSVYWLHSKLPGPLSRTHLYDYMRGDAGISLELMERINEVLGLRFTDE